MGISGAYTALGFKGGRTFLFRLPRRLMGKFLDSGLSPGKLALTLALGTTIGILPVLWGTTLICAAAAALFRLNQIAIQAVNYLVYPLQLAMFVPFFQMGKKFFPTTPSLTLNGQGGSLHTFLSRAGLSNIKAIGAWGMVAPLLAVVIYGVSLVIFRSRIDRQINP